MFVKSEFISHGETTNTYAPINDEEFEEIKTHFTLKKVRKGQYLLSEGDEVKHEYFVLSGIYKVFYIDGQEKEYILQFAQENWWMSDYPSFFKHKDASMYIECLVLASVDILKGKN
ncbi:cyclic nucleotide-binding domain-containing protein [Arcicella aquatica]|uniref:Cyclic nucleotide-binding domain-containing protein n=1 Tax=Arcicella aquatica TaxID=217141 RepID=A0ABU5QMY2_9BACT|nr:cyclic nucleotide-binding domain-containing protein [Arcicella aquatica]MEA5258418.1 cyclic nucleotide-binding domain-containing protein [Arcicella aquatica]